MRASRRHVAEANAQIARPCEVPAGWRLCALGDVAKLQPGYAFKSSWFTREGVRLLRGTNIEPGGTRWQDVVYLSQDQAREFAPFQLAVGDLVIAMDRPIISSGLKLAALREADVPSLLLQRVGRFRCGPSIDANFLHQYLRSGMFIGHIDSQATGTQLPHISGTDVETAPLPLPPVDEQRRIVAKLEALQSRSRRAREALDAVPPLLEKLRQSILAAAFRGDLTKDWRAQNPNPEPATALLARIRTERRQKWEAAELAKLKAKGKAPTNDSWKAKYKEPELVDETGLPELPMGWCWASVDELSDLQLGQQRAPMHTGAEKTFPYIRVANVTWDGLDLSDVKQMGFPDPDRYRLRAGDVLLTEASGSPSEVGKPAIWRDQIPDCCYQKTLLRARPISDGAGPEWLHLSFLADALLGRFARMAPGVGILHLTADRMRPWPVPLAPLGEQAQLLARTLAALARLNTLDRQAREFGERLTRFEQSLLSLAFRGELVARHANDEPADALLERLAVRAPAKSPRVLKATE